MFEIMYQVSKKNNYEEMNIFNKRKEIFAL